MLTEQQRAKIRQKDASTPDALKRDSLTNYSEGYFFVTLNTRGEAPILSTVVGHVGSEGADAPHCEYTELGRRVKAVIASIPQFHKAVRVIDAEVMPEHLHMLLYLQPGGTEHLGKIVGGFMGGCSHEYWDTLGIDWRIGHPTLGQKGHPNAQRGVATQHNLAHDRDHTRSFRGPALFVHGYNDVVPITPEEVQIKIEYIRKQAEKRLIQGDRHACFSIHRNCHARSWNAERALLAIGADPGFSHNEAHRQEAVRKVLERLSVETGPSVVCKPRPSEPVNPGPSIIAKSGPNATTAPSAGTPAATLAYLGNQALMANPKKLPLVCHRADAARFEEQKQAVLTRAREGWVIVSAFISPKERDIRTQLMVEQLPFIEILDNGFADRYKPVGKAFYACGENRLVQISCWNYLYNRESEISREMCLVMNELARTISGCNENWWKL